MKHYGQYDTIPDGTNHDTHTSPWMPNHVLVHTPTVLERIYNPRGYIHSSTTQGVLGFLPEEGVQQLKVRA